MQETSSFELMVVGRAQLENECPLIVFHIIEDNISHNFEDNKTGRSFYTRGDSGQSVTNVTVNTKGRHSSAERIATCVDNSMIYTTKGI